MKVFIKTPFYKDSKYIAHLLEHTIWNWWNIKDFFEIISDSYFTTFSDYILLDFYEYQEISKIKKYIFMTPSKNPGNYFPNNYERPKT